MDPLAAALGRHPTRQEAGVDHALALDGIDELVCGFITRGRSRLAEAEPFTIAVSPNDSDRGWTLSVRTDGIRTEPCAPSRPTRPSPGPPQSSAWACGTAGWR